MQETKNAENIVICFPEGQTSFVPGLSLYYLSYLEPNKHFNKLFNYKASYIVLLCNPLKRAGARSYYIS